MPDEILTSSFAIAPALLPETGSPAQSSLARPGVEVVGNWVIDRDFGVVRRRYWGKVPVEGPEFPEA